MMENLFFSLSLLIFMSYITRHYLQEQHWSKSWIKVIIHGNPLKRLSEGFFPWQRELLKRHVYINSSHNKNMKRVLKSNEKLFSATDSISKSGKTIDNIIFVCSLSLLPLFVLVFSFSLLNHSAVIRNSFFMIIESIFIELSVVTYGYHFG